MKIMSKWMILILALMVVIGCATSKELSQARQSYSEAMNDPAVVQNGAMALGDAHTALEQAQAANTWEEQINHAYIAQRNVDLAKLQAAQAKSKMELAQLQGQTNKLSAALHQESAEEQLRAYRSQTEQMQSQLSKPHFGVDQAQLSAEVKPELKRLAEFVQSNQGYRVLVEGFTDNIGTKEYNQELGQRRAEAVAKTLQADGIAPDQIIIRSMGEDFPVASNNTASGRQQNRRAEITILRGEQTPNPAGKKGGGM
ncbi:MAG: OmpA family protein [Desulfobacteraceae bacterium]|nr:OmpA family protein [Desulfobacteraceae bacterium]